MGKAQKKHGKGRLDHYYRLAKEKGYRARSSFKIIQINEKFGHFLEKSKVVIDLCAAPGSWCQVASNLCPINSLIIGVDLAAIKPLPNVTTFVSDITTEHCRTHLRGLMKTWKADTVLHDGAPNVGMAWTQDAFTQSELVLQSLKLAVEFLVQGGTFVTKVFRSKDYNNLMWVFQQFFGKVEATKPPSSRNVSAEIFVVCRDFKAPQKIDPRLLDPKHVFEDLQEPQQDMSVKVFNPEKKRRKRDGYQDGDYTQFHSISAMEFVEHEEPIQMLGSMSAIEFDTKKNPEIKKLKTLPETTPTLLESFKDLRVLGKKDFRSILKWRKAARDLLELDKPEEKVEIEVEPLTEEEQIEKELEELKDKDASKKKREKRRANEKKQKEIVRQQMNMLTTSDLGIEAGQNQQGLFSLKTAEKTNQMPDFLKGKKEIFEESDEEEEEEAEELDSDQEVDALDDELDYMYQQYKERKAEADANWKARRAREANDDEDTWYGFGEKENKDGSITSSDDEFYSGDEDAGESLTTSLLPARKNGLSRKAAVFFDDPLFKDAELEDEDDMPKPVQQTKPKKSIKKSEDTGFGDFEVVPKEDESEDSDDDWTNDKPDKPVVDIVTAEAMTMAHQLATGQKSKHDLIDEGYNRYSFRDKEGLPDWFLDDENRHSKIVRPITKEAAEAIKAKMRTMNARPIKKVAEAHARKKMRAERRLQKLLKKTDVINEDGSRSELEKSQEIAKLAKKLGSKKQKEKPKVTLVVAKGGNRGLQGRPKGIKGKYKMVDGTLKKEQRALRRVQKKKK